MRATDGTGQQGQTAPQHVWVNVTGGAGDDSPGVLVDWRRTQGGWEALVVWADGGGMRRPRTVTAWVSADKVRPLER